MFLGINLSHGSSACLTHSDGRIIYALEEERLSRVKNHVGIPKKAIELILSKAPKDHLVGVIIGSHSNISSEDAIRFLIALEENPSNPPGRSYPPHPGSKWTHSGDPKTVIENKIGEILRLSGFNCPEFIWPKHHDSHLGTTLGTGVGANSLLVSFDGEGDGESGVIALLPSNKKLEQLVSFSSFDSLGYLYEAVTSKYNFKPNQHEGKITGLAAFGAWSEAVEILSSHITILNGSLEISYAKTVRAKKLNRLKRLAKISSMPNSLAEIIDLASAASTKYEDLAYAVQNVLENSMLEILEYYADKTQSHDFALTGGVFANVKLNQKIAEAPFSREVYVFPNMGDGGISVGGVWSYLNTIGELSNENLYSDMFLAPEFNSPPSYSGLTIEALSPESKFTEIANEIANGRLVAIHQGRMEFGPRALGNRSLLLDPRNPEILVRTNKRLKRTEFMPFAPMVLESEFENYFETANATMQPFHFMTMTCKVKDEVVASIPAVTHVDQTARPQIVSRDSNEFCLRILEEFMKITGVPIVVNTSLNVHEEPINFSLEDSLSCLRRGAVDLIFTEDSKIWLANDS